MPGCKNCSNHYYTGSEPSPKGLGHCAHASKLNERKRGKDKSMWVVKKIGKSRRWVRAVPATKPKKHKKHKTPTSSKKTKKTKKLKGGDVRCEFLLNLANTKAGAVQAAGLRLFNAVRDGATAEVQAELTRRVETAQRELKTAWEKYNLCMLV